MNPPGRRPYPTILAVQRGRACGAANLADQCPCWV